MNQTITIYTDGSCETQTRQGGWAAVLSCGEHRKALSGSAADATNNMMELRAVIEALSALKQTGSQVELFTLKLQQLIERDHIVNHPVDYVGEFVGRLLFSSLDPPHEDVHEDADPNRDAELDIDIINLPVIGFYP